MFTDEELYAAFRQLEATCYDCTKIPKDEPCEGCCYYDFCWRFYPEDMRRIYGLNKIKKEKDSTTTPENLKKAISDAITECKKHEYRPEEITWRLKDWNCNKCKYESICNDIDTPISHLYD